MRHLPLVLLLAWCTIQCAGPGPSRKELANSRPPEAPGRTEFYAEEGIASWYGQEFHQKPTATGEVYDMHAMTAAHKTLPLGTWVDVIDLDT